MIIWETPQIKELTLEPGNLIQKGDDYDENGHILNFDTYIF